MSNATDAPARNDSIEKGIYLTPFNKLVHACKVREDFGAGMTRCGQRFLIGHSCYKASGVFGRESAGPQPEFKLCPQCAAAPDYSGVSQKWRDWKYIVRRTLRMIGALKD